MIHSPLVGPLTLTPLAEELRDHGYEVAVPDLRSALAAPRPQWKAILDLAIAAADGLTTDVIVGHSGAGVLMPLLAESLQPSVIAFVDAIVPSDGSQYEASEEFIAFVDALPRVGSSLPRWHTWWGLETLERLLPDKALRDQIVTDTPAVPRSLYDDPIHLPDGWASRRSCCYLQLSPAYDDDMARAKTNGWPTARLNGQHLDVATRPVDVAALLIDLIGRARN